jgi:NADPH:quinone reductase-like Zn-dependent oxidoreductase
MGLEQGHSREICLRRFRVATPGEIRAALAMALDGTITIPVDRTFPMSEAAAAHEYLGERRHVGKVILVRE